MLFNSSLRTSFVQPNHSITNADSSARPLEPHKIPFARLPHALAADTRLSPTARLLACALLFWACDRSTAEMANRSLASYLGVSVPTIERAIRELVALGYIRNRQIRPTSANMTGRVVELLWIKDPTVLPSPPTRSARPDRSEPTDMVKAPSPMMAPPHQDRGAGAIAGDGTFPSAVMGKEDRVVKKAKSSEDSRPERESILRQRSEADPEPDFPIIKATTEITLPVENKLATKPSDPSPACLGLTEGQRLMLANLNPGEIEVFEAMAAHRQAWFLKPHADGFDPSFFRITRLELRARPKQSPAVRGTTTSDFVAAVAAGDPTSTASLAEALCRDFGGDGDRRRWGAIHRMTTQLLHREIQANDVLDAYRQAMGPKAENRGAVFTTALKRNGWQPTARSTSYGSAMDSPLRMSSYDC